MTTIQNTKSFSIQSESKTSSSSKIKMKNADRIEAGIYMAVALSVPAKSLGKVPDGAIYDEISEFVGAFFQDKSYTSEQALKQAVQKDFKKYFDIKYPNYKDLTGSGHFFSLENILEILKNNAVST